MFNHPTFQHIFGYDIFVTIHRSDDWICFLRSDETQWESGNSEAEAIGKMVLRVASDQANDDRRSGRRSASSIRDICS